MMAASDTDKVHALPFQRHAKKYYRREIRVTVGVTHMRIGATWLGKAARMREQT